MPLVGCRSAPRCRRCRRKALRGRHRGRLTPPPGAAQQLPASLCKRGVEHQGPAFADWLHSLEVDGGAI
jgi:hypothetical protein